MNHLNITTVSKREYIIIGITALIALLISVMAVMSRAYFLPIIPLVLLVFFVYTLFLFQHPVLGLYTSVLYCFLQGILGREIGGVPFGIGNEILQLLTWLSVWYNAKKFNFKILNNDLIWLTLGWFIYSFVQIINPAGASPAGWLQEMRTSALYPLLLTPLAVLLLNNNKRVNTFLIIIFIASVLGSINGIKQAKIGLSAGEQAFLDANPTHMIWGNLRAFSFYNDAGQFGSSQAHFVILAIILAVGLKGWAKKIILLLIAFVSFYGMLVSGTRGGLFTLVGGLFCALLLSRNLKALAIGGAVTLILLFVLKFTYIGQSNYNINRLRTAVNPVEDASMNLRLINQKKLADYLRSHPFGGGLGVIGRSGSEYNSDKYLSTIPPDSYWVKVWAMYGIVGLILFFCMWLYIIGKCCGMIWNVRDVNLRVKLVALISGVIGIFLCSYGNEIMNAMPSLAVIHLSLGAIYIMCKNYYNKEKHSYIITK